MQESSNSTCDAGRNRCESSTDSGAATPAVFAGVVVLALSVVQLAVTWFLYAYHSWLTVIVLLVYAPINLLVTIGVSLACASVFFTTQRNWLAGIALALSLPPLVLNIAMIVSYARR